MRLAGRTALVTGASSGVGRAIAVRLAREGASVGLTGRDAGRLEAATGEAREAGGEASWLAADLHADDDVRGLASWVVGALGAPDILVHSAGDIAFGAVERAGVEALDRQFRTNLRAPYLLTQLLLPSLRERAGQVVFVNSTAGLAAGAQSGAYAATKHGLRALADSLRDEVNGEGVRVLSLFLGRTATPMQARVHAHETRPYRPERLVQPADVAELVAALVCLPSTAEVTDVRLRPALKPTAF